MKKFLEGAVGFAALGNVVGLFVFAVSKAKGIKNYKKAAEEIKKRLQEAEETEKSESATKNDVEIYSFESSAKNKFYFIVVCKVGHVGKNYFTTISYPIIAENGREAAKIARYLPRVKHDQPDAIISCTKVTKEEYEAQKEENKKNPFLNCVNRQMQRPFEETLEILEEDKEVVKRTKKHSLRKTQNFLPKEVEFMHGDIKSLELA